MIRTRLDLEERVGAGAPASGYATNVRVSIDVDLSSLDGEEMRFVEALLDAVGLAPSMLARAQRLAPPVPDPVGEEPATMGVDEGGSVEPVEPDVVAPAPAPARKPRSKLAAATAPTPARPTRSRGKSDLGVRMLKALHDAGGEIFDPAGRAAATMLADAIGATPDAHSRKVIAVLADQGLIGRTVTGKRTSRIVLTAKGLAVVDSTAPGDVQERPSANGPETAPHPNGNGTAIVGGEKCVHCGDTFGSKQALGRHREQAHPITAKPHPSTRAASAAGID